MTAASKHKVKRVVITSSVVAVSVQPSDNDPHRYSEKHWTDLKAAANCTHFMVKTLAEKAAWDFHKDLAKGEHCPEVVTILPSQVVGEVISSGGATTTDMYSQIIMNKYTKYPDAKLNCVDIKDVARAHLRACEIPEAAGKRFILSLEDHILMIEQAQILNAVLKENGYNYKMKPVRVSTSLIRCFARCMGRNKEGKAFAELLDAPGDTYDNTQSRQILGIKY